MKGLLLHPFAILIYSLIIGSFLVFNNEANADGTIPVFFYGAWSIYLGFAVYAAGLGWLGYCIWKSIKDKKARNEK